LSGQGLKDVVERERGTVVSIVSSWHPIGDGSARKRLRLLVEYDTDEGPVLARIVTTDQHDLRVGSEVFVLRRPGGRLAVQVDDPVAVRPWWQSAQPRSGLLAFSGLVLLMLVLAGGIWLSVSSRSDQILPQGPPASPVDGSTGGPSGEPTGSPSGSPSPSAPASSSPPPAAGGD
jgi:hypothetical protein